MILEGAAKIAWRGSHANKAAFENLEVAQMREMNRELLRQKETR